MVTPLGMMSSGIDGLGVTVEGPLMSIDNDGSAAFDASFDDLMAEFDVATAAYATAHALMTFLNHPVR